SVVILSLLLAILLNKFIPGITLFRAAFFLPIVINLSVSAIAIRWIMDSQIGLLNRVLIGLSIPPQSWLNQQGWAMVVVVLVVLWSSVGFNIIIFLAGLRSISEEIYDAALVDGSTGLRTVIHITIPLLRPVIL